MTATKESQYTSVVSSLQDSVSALCSTEGLSEKIVLEKLLHRLGYKMPRLTRRNKRSLEFNQTLIKRIKEKDEEITERIKEGRKVVRMDRNKAHYLIETALMKFKCTMAGRTLKKKDIDGIFGYCDRTMRYQQVSYRDKVLCSGTTEYKIVEEIYEELASYSIE